MIAKTRLLITWLSLRQLIVVALALGAVVTSGCRDPTQITLTLHTNAACADVAGTAISVGGPDEVESQAPVATTSTCAPDPEGGDIGSLVLVPANADDAAVGVKVTLSVGDTLETCLAPPYDDCIVARRSLRYIAHTLDRGHRHRLGGRLRGSRQSLADAVR